MALLEVSPEMLLRALKLPSDTKLLEAKTDPNYYGGVLLMRIEHPDLPAVRHGECLRKISASVYGNVFVKWDL